MDSVPFQGSALPHVDVSDRENQDEAQHLDQQEAEEEEKGEIGLVHEFVKKFTCLAETYSRMRGLSTESSSVSVDAADILAPHVHQIRPLDSAHGHRARDDRAVRREPGSLRRHLV